MSLITAEELNTYEIIDLIRYCKELNINLKNEMIEKDLLINIIINYETFKSDKKVKDIVLYHLNESDTEESDTDSDINIYFS